jgi:hypothetical protein
MNVRNATLFVVAAVAVFAPLCFGQSKAVDAHGAMLFEGRPFFTDSALYNSYDLGGSPLGLFEKGFPRFGAMFDYRYDGLGNGSGQYWDAPRLTMGNPGGAYFQAYYGPGILSLKNGADGGGAVGLPLHRFGLAVASQGTSGALRASLIAEGFYGRQEWDGNVEKARVFMGFDRLRLDLGSRVHPLARVGLYVGTRLGLDTLSEAWRADRSFYINLPEFGAGVDFGGEGVPVRSNVSFSYAWSRFIYTTWGRNMNANDFPNGAKPGHLGYDNGYGGDANVIRNDSLSVFWATRAHLLSNDEKIALNPGLLLGFTNNSGEMREPGTDNHLINIGGAYPGLSYGMSGIWFGVGMGFEAQGYVDAHVEYALSAMSLECGPGYTGSDFKTSQTLHHVAIGLSTKAGNFVELPVAIAPRVAWFISGAANMAGPAQARLGVAPLNDAPRVSKRSLYEPQNFLNGFRHVSGFTVGADADALEGAAVASIYATFLSSDKEDRGGLEFGAKMGFALK